MNKKKKYQSIFSCENKKKSVFLFGINLFYIKKKKIKNERKEEKKFETNL